LTTSNTDLYPLELSLNRLRKPWGGFPGKVGEIWSLSGPPLESLVLNGPLAGQHLTEIVGEYQQTCLGEGIELDPREPFPVLLRFISTIENQPIQVHPHDAYTLHKGLPMVGRHKAFYILDARVGSQVHLGFRDYYSKREIVDAVEGQYLEQLLNQVTVRSGDLYTVPAGRIHAVDKGVTLLEVQRHSTLTFELLRRSPDEEKTDASEDELREAMEILDITPLTPKSIPSLELGAGESKIEYLLISPNFMLRRLTIRGLLDISLSGHRFMAYTGLKGEGWVRWGFTDTFAHIQPFQTVLVPAVKQDLFFESQSISFEVLETTVPNLACLAPDHATALGISLDRLTALGGDDWGGILKQCLC
jgi:mannose-6-phosphate isomerase